MILAIRHRQMIHFSVFRLLLLGVVDIVLVSGSILSLFCFSLNNDAGKSSVPVSYPRISATHVWRRSWSSPYRASWICSLYRIDDGLWYKVCFIYIYSVAQESDSLSHLTNNDLFSFWILYYILSLLIWKTQRGSDLPLDKHCCNVNGFFPSLCKDRD